MSEAPALCDVDHSTPPHLWREWLNERGAGRGRGGESGARYPLRPREGSPSPPPVAPAYVGEGKATADPLRTLRYRHCGKKESAYSTRRMLGAIPLYYKKRQSIPASRVKPRRRDKSGARPPSRSFRMHAACRRLKLGSVRIGCAYRFARRLLWAFHLLDAQGRESTRIPGVAEIYFAREVLPVGCDRCDLFALGKMADPSQKRGMRAGGREWRS